MKRSLPSGFRFDAELVCIGASAGGIDALGSVLADLPRSFPATLVALLHLPEQHPSQLPELFSRRVQAPVAEAVPGAPILPGHIYFAPPGYHLLVEEDRRFALSCDAPVLFSRPSIDVLMESCADAYGPALAALVLTGANEDGARGLRAVRMAGGLTAVQDPAEAQHPTMPEAAMRAAQPDFVLPLAGLRQLVHSVMLHG